MYDLLTLLSPKSIIVFILVLTRLGGMIMNAPLFSTYPIPMQIKAGMLATIAFLMYPMIMAKANFVVPHDMITLSLMIGKELFVGTLIGFCAGLIFTAIQTGGMLLSTQIGLSAGDILDPVTKQNTPVIGEFYILMASMIFLSINGHHWLFSSVYDSYNAVPIGLQLHLSGVLVDKIVFFTSQIFTVAFGIIIPIYGVLFITDVTLGLVSKMMPQMNIFMVALPLKIYLGLALMVLFMASTGIYLHTLIQELLNNISTLFT